MTACGTGATDPAAADAGPPAPECPPLPPYGVAVGERLPGVALRTCDGDDLSLHDLCGANAGLTFHFFGW